MTDILVSVQGALAAMSPWEAIAVVLAIAYLLLAMKQNLWCWACALLSTAIYTVLLWDVSLLLQSALNVFYMVMAVYGWWQWRAGGARHEGVAIHRWSWQQHLLALFAVLAATLLSGRLLVENTSAALPYVDGFVTWGSVLTTWMVAKKILENWLYWVVVDGMAVFLYASSGLYLTAGLFGLYVILVIFGYFNWRRQAQGKHVATA
jgi:nicotinamide mononucleotide transporter